MNRSNSEIFWETCEEMLGYPATVPVRYVPNFVILLDYVWFIKVLDNVISVPKIQYLLHCYYT